MMIWLKSRAKTNPPSTFPFANLSHRLGRAIRN
jgi:hypothetical protein